MIRNRQPDTYPARSFEPMGEGLFPREADTAPNRPAECLKINCPNCGGEYTHQERTTVYSRCEDGAAVLTAVHPISGISAQSEDLNSDTQGNPSPRRHGVRIEATCEMCPGTFSIEIIQHKGQTFVQLVVEAHASGEQPVEIDDGLTEPALTDDEREQIAQQIEPNVGKTQTATLAANRADRHPPGAHSSSETPCGQSPGFRNMIWYCSACGLAGSRRNARHSPTDRAHSHGSRGPKRAPCLKSHER